MKLLKIIGAFVYAVLASYLIWLLFHWLTPLVMSFSTIWKLLLLVLVFEPIIVGLLISAAAIIATPVFMLLKNTSAAAKVLISIPFLFHCFSSARLPWLLDIPYNAIPVIIAISISISALCIFGAIVSAVFKSEEFK